MSDKKIKFAIVGYGNIGKRHEKVIQNEEKALLTGICDNDKEQLKSTQEKGYLFAQTDFKTFIQHVDADVLSICTPHHLHAGMTIQALDKGLHVIVEKPMCLSIKEGEEMIKAAELNNRNLFVVKQNRYNIPVSVTHEAIQKNMLGKIHLITCSVLWNRYEGYYTDSNWRGKKATEKGALYTQGSHFIDLLVWWFGDIITAKTIAETKMHAIETDDCGTSVVKFKNGALGSISWTTNVYNKNYEGSITIIGEKGTIKIGGQYLNEIEYWDVKSFPLPANLRFIDKPNIYSAYQGSSSNHDLVYKNIISSLNNESANIIDGEEGLKTIRAIEKIYQSGL